jgi:hypothetical protein
MSFEKPIRLLYEGLGSIMYGSPPATPPGTIAVDNADSGVTIGPAGTVILGNQTASITDATLLSNSIIPLGGFDITLSEIGEGVDHSKLIFADVSTGRPINQPQILFEDGTGAEIGRINFTTTGSIYIGTNSGKAILTGETVNTGVGDQTFTAITLGTRNSAFGFNALGLLTTGSENTAVGQEALSNLLTGVENTAVGRNAGLGMNAAQTQTTLIGAEIQVPSGSNVTIVGFGSGGSIGLTQAANGSTFIGSEILFNAPVYGINNTIVGFSNFIGAGQTIGASNIVIGTLNTSAAGGMGSNNIVIGSQVNLNTIVVTNTIIIVPGVAAFSVPISNIVVLGNSTQNTIIGSTTNPTDNGTRLQVRGAIRTAGVAPLTLGSAAWDMGNIKTAASVLNATQYLELSVAGVLVKVCIN